MNAHELAKALLAGPNAPVVINGWGSDEGFTFEVTEVSPLGTCAFSGAKDTKRTPRNALGYPNGRKCVCLYHCGPTPASEKQIRDEAARRRKEQDLKRRDPEAHKRLYVSITPLTPEDLMRMAEAPIDAKKFVKELKKATP